MALKDRVGDSKYLESFNIVDIVNSILELFNTSASKDGTETLTNKTLTSFKGTLDKAEYTQDTSITTGVVTETQSGVITTVSATLTPGDEASFTISNPYIKSNSVVDAVIEYDTAGATGYPIVILGARVDGAIKLIIKNVHSTSPLNAPIKIHYIIF